MLKENEDNTDMEKYDNMLKENEDNTDKEKYAILYL